MYVSPTVLPPTPITTNKSPKQNKTISDSNDGVLKIQGVAWLKRKAIGAMGLTLPIRETVDPSTGTTTLSTDAVAGGAPPGPTEKRLVDGEPMNVNHPLFGKGVTRTRWVEVAGLDDDYLARGREEGTEELMQFVTENLDQGAVTMIVGGFEKVDGKRYYTRHIVVKKGSESVKVRMHGLRLCWSSSGQIGKCILHRLSVKTIA